MPAKTKNFFGITDVGKMRDNNEDSFIAEPLGNSPYILACVIDGVGGYEGGEVAAELARSTVASYLHIPSGEMKTMIREAIHSANEKIIAAKAGNERLSRMACVITLALADIQGSRFYYGHVGDTRLYLFRDKTLVKITRDQSFVGFLEDSGKLTEEAAMMHPKRNEINKALGFQANISQQTDYAEIGESPFLPGDILLLCSDGLSDLVDSQVMSAVLNAPQTLEQKARALVDAANKAGGKDNITVVLVMNDARPVKLKATRPAPVKKNESPDGEEPVEEEAVRKKTNWVVPLLALLVLGLIGLAFWYYYRPFEDNGVPQPDNNVVVQTPAEKALNDSLQLSGRLFEFNPSLFGDTILVQDGIRINRDTMIIQGHGVLLLGDTSLKKRPVLVISANCRYILVDSLKLHHFEIVLEGENDPLHFRHVQLYNCLLRNRELLIGDSTRFTGRIRTQIKTERDTLINFNR